LDRHLVVGFFPSTTRARFLGRPARFRTIAACAALVLVGTVVPHAAADDLTRKKREAQGQVRSAQGELAESSKALTSAARRLEHARAALSAAQGRLDKAQNQVDAAARLDARMQQRLQAAEHRLAVARVQLDTARQRVTDQRAAIGQLAASNYANGDPALMGLAVMLNSQDPEEVTSQMNTVDTLMDKQTMLLVQLKAARARMVAQEARVEKAKAAVAAQRKEARANLVMKQGLERSAAQARAEVATLVARGRAAAAQAARARKADLVQLRKAKQQEEHVRRLILQRARQQHGGFKGSSGGFLQRPVPGMVTSPYGWRRHPIYGYWGLHDGTDFRAPCGTPNRAAGSGTVISEFWSDVYGNRLYLDLGKVNGKNMTVIYNHLSSYRVGAGARVKRGEVVGYAGTTGWSTACHLHFTVMLNGSPVNPMNYM
jgi:murein DD-endopeptidase MepM/ murein hydrolase activator NlpD